MTEQTTSPNGLTGNVHGDTRYLSATETGKLLRKALKAGFPGIKFTVNRRGGGFSYTIGWTDGPTTGEVDKIGKLFAGSRLEGMTDCGYSASSWYCARHGARVAATYGCDVASNNAVHESRCCAQAELVHFGADFVFTSRTLSPEFTEELATVVRRKSGLPADAALDTPLPQGSLYQYYPFDAVSDGVYKLARETARTDTMWRVTKLHERAKELVAEIEGPTGDAPIPPMRWAPWGRIVVRSTGTGRPGDAVHWYDPMEFPGDRRVWSDDEVADWPALGRVPNPTPEEN